MQNGAGKSKRLEGYFNHHTFAIRNGLVATALAIV